ncbi:heterokaryon incompatibility protein-domain-containing protein [Cladorrhinum samala]|uniref:Heterokaryon incompatibility protein-domain-containing protein n=1 Tax=Cladorrhinum samala TaxID=585594 RepID=A0AAV9HVP3_9PEZI|nr:heterokaryon incompatibility protein-domain-containing protein [Cladorrhinum samala]
MDCGSPDLSAADNTILASPGCWQQANFSTSVKLALQQGCLDPNTSWTEDDLVYPHTPDDDVGCMIPSPEPDEGFEGAWFRWNTPLHRAVWVDDLEAVEQLLASGADINKHNEIGLTALHEAVRSQKLAAAGLLLKHGADPNKLTNAAVAKWWKRAWDTGDVSREEAHEPGYQVALYYTLLNRDTAITRLLIERGADLRHAWLGGWTFLDLALLAEDHEAFDVFRSWGIRLSTSQRQETTFDGEALESRRLLSVATSDCIKPHVDLHPIYCHALSKLEPQLFSKLEEHSSISAIDQIIRSFFDVLYLAAGVRPSTPVVKFCQRCAEFHGQLRHRKLPDQDARFILHPNRQDLELSADRGCALCSLVADAIDEDEPRVRREAESGEQFYTPPDAEPEPDGKDPTVYLNVVRGPEINTRQYYLRIRCQKWRSSLPISRVEEGAFPFYNPGEEDRMGLGTASKRTFQTAGYWLKNCKSSPAHGACQRTPNLDSGSADSFPSRLIYVPPTDQEDAQPFLVNGRDVRGQPYVALSYCWGLTATLRTTKSNVSQHFRSIGPINSLPATIRDAILATQYLGLSYIWIDALCIIQDDLHDWSSEAKIMHLIYLNAELTVSSLTAKASTDPFFLPSKIRSVYPVPTPFWEAKSHRPPYMPSSNPPAFYTHAIFRTWLHTSSHDPSAFLSGPIHTRGWTLQEQLLSTRTLIFGNGILHWECLCQYTTEADPTSSAYRDAQLARYVPQIEAKCSIRGGVGQSGSSGIGHWLAETWDWRKTRFEVWQDLVGELTRREFTRFEDRLPAFMGVAKFMVDNGLLSLSAAAAAAGKTEEMEFVGGVWKGELLLQSLCWNAVAPVKEDEKAGEDSQEPVIKQPSWTWVGLKGEIGFCHLDRSGREDREPVPKVVVESVAVDVDPVTFRVGGSIALRGRLYRKKALEELVEEESVDSPKYSFDYEGVSGMEDLCILEVLAFPRGPLPTGFGYPMYPEGRPPEIVFLILQRLGGVQTEVQEGEYRRVGVGSYTWEGYCRLKDPDDPLLEAGCVVEVGSSNGIVGLIRLS